MSKFEPIRLQDPPREPEWKSRLTVSATLKGDVCQEFEKMAEEYGLNRSQLIVQMVHHCLGRTEELKDFYRRLAILAASK